MKCTACGAHLVSDCPSNVLCSDDCLDAFVAAPSFLAGGTVPAAVA